MGKPTGLDGAQARFMTLLPRIRQHARIYFRNVPCPVQREERVADVIALAWRWFCDLQRRGKDAADFPAAFASLAAKAVRSGRRLCGQEKAKDAMSCRAQQRHGFYVGKLPDCSTLSDNPLTDALTDNPGYDPAVLAAFRVDFPEWRKSRSQRDRRLIDQMMAGERTLVLARRFGLSPARVSQLRREFHDDWLLYIGERSVPCPNAA